MLKKTITIMCDNNFIASESNRCIGCARPSCRRACPVNNDIPTFVRAVKNGDYSGATDIVGHPFGEICGYVCPRELHCTAHCVLSAKGAAVQIGKLEREIFAAYPYIVQRRGNLLGGKKVAVVGGGVSGITFAVKAYEQGADVTVYERDVLLSTLQLIPNFRLPRSAIDRVLCGVQGKLDVRRVNVDGAALKQIADRYDIVYLATGQSRMRCLGVEGEQLAVPYNVFLSDYDCCGSVIVIGGGNTAIDCARTALKRGCKATVVYRRQRADMPAFNSEIAAAVDDGVEFCFNVAPVNIVCDGDGLALTVCRTVSEGRNSLTVLADQTSVMHCNTVVSALGGSFDDEIYSQLTLGNDKYNPIRGLYAGGDATGGSLVAHAVRDALHAFDKTIQSLGE